MFQLRAFSTVIAGAMFVLAGWHVALGDADWLGLCREGTGEDVSTAAEEPLQKCSNLTDCNISYNTACTAENSLCKRMVGGVETDSATKAKDSRSIQVGDCQTPTTSNPDDKCWHCVSPKELVCHVDYKYGKFENGSCVDRCPKVEGIATATGKCKP